jgi:DNA-binding GntR family transcriptional regulator
LVARNLRRKTAKQATDLSWSDLLAALAGTLDRSNEAPLYQQIADEIQVLIESGAFPRGSLFGNEIELARQLGVSRPTMRRAIKVLVDQGMLVRRRGVGTQVVQGHISRPAKLTSLFEDLTESGQDPRTAILLYQWVQATDQVGAKLQIPRGELVLHLRRLRTARQEPLAILENYLPNDLGDIDQDTLTTDGLYHMMRSRGFKMATATQRIGARNGTAAECQLLQEPAGSPLLTVDRLAFDDSGRPIEWGRHLYRPTMYAFSITLVR